MTIRPMWVATWLLIALTWATIFRVERLRRSTHALLLETSARLDSVRAQNTATQRMNHATVQHCDAALDTMQMIRDSLGEHTR